MGYLCTEELLELMKVACQDAKPGSGRQQIIAAATNCIAARAGIVWASSLNRLKKPHIEAASIASYSSALAIRGFVPWQ